MARTIVAGDYDYERGGGTYPAHRRADPKIARRVHAALGGARTVVNVGAGTGSYEPEDRPVVAVEPSARMRSLRPDHLAPAIGAVASALPFDDDTFDAAMAMITVHQWNDSASGLAELGRVARDRVVLLTFDGDALDRLWLSDYLPEMYTHERRRFQPLDWLCAQLGGDCTVEPVPVPVDCHDGFTEAYYARPEQFLRREVRMAQSCWGFVDGATQDRFEAQLRADLDSGAWQRRYGDLLNQPTFEGALRLVTAHLA